MKTIKTTRFSGFIAIIAMASACTVHAAQFSFLDPSYTQEIYTGPLVGGPGMAWTSSNHLLTRNGASILEYSPTQNASYQTSPTPATPIHGVIATHAVSGLVSSGYGITNGTNGYLYTNTSNGLYQIDPSAWTASQVSTVTGQSGYGITTLPDGRIAYAGGGGDSSVYIYNPAGGSNTLVYTAPTLVDDMQATPTGEIVLAGYSIGSLIVIDSIGNLVNSFGTGGHNPDGLAIGIGSIYSNNNDGTITQFTFSGPGYTGTPTQTVIASGSQAYGDLAAVGPDCAFYVSQFDNGGLNGSTAGVGTHWDNGVTTNEPSIIRIGSRSGACLFMPPPTGVPEPDSTWLIGIGLATLLLRRKNS